MCICITLTCIYSQEMCVYVLYSRVYICSMTLFLSVIKKIISLQYEKNSHAHASLETHMPTCIHTYIYIYIDRQKGWINQDMLDLHPLTYIHKCIHIHTHTHTFAYMYITHTHIHIGMKRAYAWINQDMLDSVPRAEWKPLLWVLCHLHCVVQVCMYLCMYVVGALSPPLRCAGMYVFMYVCMQAFM